MKNTLKIVAPKGYEIDIEMSTFKEIVFKVKNDLPNTWLELKLISGYFIGVHSQVSEFTNGTMHSNRNTFPNQELAEAAAALAQLLQLRDRYNDGWIPDYSDDIIKFIIVNIKGHVEPSITFNVSRVLMFETAELRNKFYENFQDLMEIAKPLL